MRDLSTVELSGRAVAGRPGPLALSFGDDAGVDDECVYKQPDLVQALPNRQGGWIYRHSEP